MSSITNKTLKFIYDDLDVAMTVGFHLICLYKLENFYISHEFKIEEEEKISLTLILI